MSWQSHFVSTTRPDTSVYMVDQQFNGLDVRHQTLLVCNESKYIQIQLNIIELGSFSGLL